MPNAKKIALILILILSQESFAMGEMGDAFQFYEEEAKVVIATQREQTPEQAPSIISIVTRHDIEAYGARDLADILRLVPGFEFGVDVDGLVGLSDRGIWVHEGKVLLMVNGIIQNDFGYGNYNFIGSIPASIIEKVEIIRGPGSAIYGGFAEVSVINVITHQAEHLNGMRASGDIGTMGNGGSSRFGNISYGNAKNDVRMAAHVGYGIQPLSERDYTDFFGNRIPLGEKNSFREWQHIIVDASAHNLSLNYHRSSLTYLGQDGFTTIFQPVNGIPQERLQDFVDTFQLKYKQALTDRLSLEPLFEYNRGSTIAAAVLPVGQVSGALEDLGASDTTRYRSQLLATYDHPAIGQLTLGGGYIWDGIENVARDGTPGLQFSTNPNDTGSKGYTQSTFGLLQYIRDMNPFGLTLGARYEDTTFGHAFAPRAGLTYIHNAFNAKLLYGRAFRIPLPWQVWSKFLNFPDDLRPEIANTTELELGYKFTPHLTGKVNAFFIDINKPIVYNGATNSYTNFGEIQSEGAEAELRLQYAHYGGFANLSYATPGPDTSPGFTTQSRKQFLAMPPLKVDLGAYYRQGIMEYSPSVTYLSARAGQSSDSANDPNGTLGTTDYNALLLANMNIIAHDVVKNFDIHLAVHNIFDTRYVLIQPYFGAHAPLPAQDREITLGVTWHI